MERNNQNPNILENLRIVILEVVEKLEAELNNKFKGKRFPTMVYEGVRYHASKFVKVNVPKFGVAGGNIVDIKNWSITARTLHTKARTITIPFPAI